MDPILFSGSVTLPAPSEPDDLNAIDAHTFSRMLNHWIAVVWVHRANIPSEQSELDTFDALSLIPEFRRSYPDADWREMSRGTSIEETWLGFQLSTRTAARCLISAEFAGQPIERISRKTMLEPEAFVSSLRRWMMHPQPRCHAMVRTSPGAGHSILLVGLDPDTGWFKFWDPWPGRSLLCAENNTVGIDAVPDEFPPLSWSFSNMID